VHIDLGIAFEQVVFSSLLSPPLSHVCCHARENYSRSQSASRSA
jgi:hypothetical protein